MIKRLFIIILTTVSLSAFADDTTITINNKQYIIIDNYDRPYTVQIDNDTFFESYDLNEIIIYIKELP